MQKQTNNLAPVWSMALAVAATLGAFSESAQAIPAGWTCAGSCGTLGADGVVSAPPTPPGATTYDYITTNGASGSNGASLSLGGGTETNGSLLTSSTFSAAAGDALQFSFNYVTSDGAGFADYAWASLVDADTNTLVGYLVTARTKTAGSIIPGQGMPSVLASLTPPSVPIIGGAPSWSALGGSSGTCYSTGCGYTGWVVSDYTIGTAGNYKLQFGVVNWNDTLYNSGLAISGAKIGTTVIEDVPEPGSIALVGAALLGLFAAGRRRA